MKRQETIQAAFSRQKKPRIDRCEDSQKLSRSGNAEKKMKKIKVTEIPSKMDIEETDFEGGISSQESIFIQEYEYLHRRVENDLYVDENLDEMKQVESNALIETRKMVS